MSDDSACPCEVVQHPRAIDNPAGRASLSRRVGDFASFRHALLRAREGEIELLRWRPGPTGDLAVQMVEWWAVIADALTFYDERVANESYLRTALIDEDVRRLIRLLGYRPRPGIGAEGQIAARVAGPRPPSLAAGLRVESKPGPGQQPQTFELDAAKQTVYPDELAVDAPPDDALAASGSSVLVRGGSVAVRKGDYVLLLPVAWDGTSAACTYTSVTAVTQEKDPRGATNTRLTLASVPAGASAGDYRLLRPTVTARLWPYQVASVALTDTAAHLESCARQVVVGDPVCFNLPGTTAAIVAKVTAYTELVWYANAADATPGTAPTGDNVIPIPIPHAQISFNVPGLSIFAPLRNAGVVLFGWQEVGELIATPASALDTPPASLSAVAPALFPAGQYQAMLEDADGCGALVTVTAGTEPASTAAISYVTDPAPALKPPLRLLLNVLDVSRGRTVADEVLGSGDASVPGQEFVLAKAPLTYLQASGSAPGESWRSTLRVSVDGIEWAEAESFYGQASDARVFATHEDEEGKTHVAFGDGENGARLPTGPSNVVANYRYGSGAEAPDVGALNVIVQPVQGLKSFQAPAPVGGGSDPDPSDQVKRYGPLSATTFGRAVSADDYQSIAARAPGVSRARAYFRWDPDEQRPLVKVYVGDNQAAVDSARTALSLACDPNRRPLVVPATPVPISIRVAVVRDLAYDEDMVLDAVRAALADPDAGLFGANVVRVGQTFFTSQIDAACLSVAGVLAAHGVEFRIGHLAASTLDATYRHVPGEGGFFQLSTDDLDVTAEPGDGG